MRVCPNDMCVHFEVLLCSELCAFWQQSRHVCMLRLQFGSNDFHSGVPLCTKVANVISKLTIDSLVLF
jgi:hypothetical protein